MDLAATGSLGSKGLPPHSMHVVKASKNVTWVLSKNMSSSEVDVAAVAADVLAVVVVVVINVSSLAVIMNT